MAVTVEEVICMYEHVNTVMYTVKQDNAGLG